VVVHPRRVKKLNGQEKGQKTGLARMGGNRAYQNLFMFEKGKASDLVAEHLLMGYAMGGGGVAKDHMGERSRR